MNTDPIGTQGAPKAGDLQMALDGGSDFAERLRQLSIAKDAAAQALASLSLGKEVRAAHIEAKRTAEMAVQEARRIIDEATGERTKAKDEADAIRRDATFHADNLVKDAKEQVEKMVADAAAIRAAADEYVKNAKTRADAALNDAVLKQKEAGKLRDQVEAQLAKHTEATEKAAQSIKDALETKAKLDGHLAELRDFLSKV